MTVKMTVGSTNYIVEIDSLNYTLSKEGEYNWEKDKTPVVFIGYLTSIDSVIDNITRDQFASSKEVVDFGGLVDKYRAIADEVKGMLR